DKLGPDPLRNGAIKAGFIHEAAVDHRLHDGLAVLLRFGQDVVSLRFLQYVLIDKKIEDLLVIHSSSAHIRNRYRDYFVGRGQTGKNFAHAVLTQSAHA